MKKTVLIAIAVVISASVSAQFAFSVNPGITTNSATFGYKVKKFVPYLGVQMLFAKGQINDFGKENDNNGNIVDFNNTLDAKIRMITPTIGLKYFFVESNKLKAYGNINASKSLFGGEIDDSQDPKQQADEDFQDVVQNMKLFTMQFGFGTEYFFDNNFSIGGEFGLRMISFKAQDTYTNSVSDPNTGNLIDVINTTAVTGKINPTYAKLSLNFYFGKE